MENPLIQPMKWSSPQVVTAVGSIIAGFLLCFVAYFHSTDNDVPEGVLLVLGQAFVYAGTIFGCKVYIDHLVHKQTNSTKKKDA